MLTQIGKRMLTLPFPFSRLSDQSKQRLSTCAVGTFVLAPLFPSACNRETSSKCKKGSFLRVLPRKSRHVTKTTLSFTDSSCQESDSLPTASFPLFFPPHRYWPSRSAGKRRRKRRTHPWRRARRSPHICSSPPPLWPSLPSSCESAAFHHLLAREEGQTPTLGRTSGFLRQNTGDQGMKGKGNMTDLVHESRGTYGVRKVCCWCFDLTIERTERERERAAAVPVWGLPRPPGFWGHCRRPPPDELGGLRQGQATPCQPIPAFPPTPHPIRPPNPLTAHPDYVDEVSNGWNSADKEGYSFNVNTSTFVYWLNRFTYLRKFSISWKYPQN